MRIDIPMQNSKSLSLSLVLLLFGLASLAFSQQQTFNVSSSPIITQNGSREQISICFADCQSCTARNGECQVCFSPWFVKDQNQVCTLRNDSTYIEQSTAEERRSEARIASLSWLIDGGQTPFFTCSLKNQQTGAIQKQFNVTGMLANQNLIYRRTISIHDYLGMKFLLILTNWCQDCVLNITLTTDDRVLANESLTFDHPRIINADRENICSGTQSDIRLSFTLNAQEKGSRRLTLSFIPFIPAGNNAQWGVGTFALITGNCNQSCQTCNGFNSNINSCTYCKNFLADAPGGQKCSACLQGFALNQNETRCQKCAIEFSTCSAANTPLACQYPNLTSVAQNCSLNSTSQYTDRKYISNPLFSSSLFNVAGRGSSTLTCDDFYYSMVGPASPGELISRTFLTLPPHLQMSINFNVFIIDQNVASRRYTVVLRVDGQTITLDPNQQVITITGTSNVCGQYDKVDALATFSTNKFFPHEKTQNVRVEVGLGTVTPGQSLRWGLRDVRLVYRLCDQNCLNCTEDGCQTCVNNLQLVGLRCQGCVGGGGIIQNSNYCGACPNNCLQCKIYSQSNKTCTSCQSGYYLYSSPENKTTCEIYPNYFPLNSDSGGQWQGGSLSNQCNLQFYQPSSEGSEQNLQVQSQTQFIVAQNSMRKTFQSGNNTYKKRIAFDLLKIDDWGENFLDIYVNDLRVYHKQFNSTGSNICFNGLQNDQIMHEQITIEDNNSTTTVEFQVVDPNYWKLPASQRPANPRSARFGIANFQLQKIGCAQCAQQSFGYKVKHNIDDTLKVFVEFNRVYENSNVEDFKNIFEVRVGDDPVDYDMYWNDSIVYILSAKLNEQIINKNVSVVCKYPQRVVTDLSLWANEQKYFQVSQDNTNDAVRRMMEQQLFLGQQNMISQASAKALDMFTNFVEVQRFTPLKGYKSSIEGVATFFAIISRIVIYVGFASFFIGCQTSCTHFMHNLQKLWLHIFVAALVVSPVLKTALTGFRETQNQNIAINPQGWESGLPQYLYYDTFAPLQQYYSDVNFFRNIYNIAIAFLILIIVYFVMRVITSKFFKKRSDSLISRHLRMTFSYRPVWYFNSIIYYQYLTLVIACILQFNDLTSRTSNLGAFNGLSAAAAIIAFVFATVYPLAIHFYLSRKRNQYMGDYQYNKTMANVDIDTYLNNNIIYNNKYSQIFFRFLPKYLWNRLSGEIDAIGQRQFFYNILRFGEMWWLAIVTILLYWNPFAQVFLLMVTTAFHLLIVLFFRLSFTKTFKILKSLQLLFFLGLEIIMVVMERLSGTLREQSYNTLAIVAIIFIFMIIFLSIIRVFYTAKRIYWEYQNQKHMMQGLCEFIRIIPNENGEFDIVD